MKEKYTLVGLCIESGSMGQWRIIDPIRKIRTPWLASYAFSDDAKKAAMYAVARTELDELTHCHTVEDNWIVVHSF